MKEVSNVLDFIANHIVSLIFSFLFVSLVIFMLKLNFGNGDYKHFKLAQMIARSDGTLDRKAMERTVLFLVSVYGFLHVMHKFPDQITSYFLALSGVWLAAHVAADKLPTRVGPQRTTDQSSPAEPPSH